MAVRSALAPSGSRVTGTDRDAAIVAEKVSKRYPRTPVTIFPPVVSIFHRDLLNRKRSSADAEARSTDAERRPAQDSTAPPSRPRGRQRGPALDDEYLDDELDDEDDDDLEDEGARAGGPTPNNPGEMFWALRDVSFRVPAGGALGVLGGPDAGKSTLLSILGGQSFPTEGRVLVRDRVSPLSEPLAKALNLSNSGTHKFSLFMASRLMGIEKHLVKRYREEIEEMAGPVLGDDGEPVPGAFMRLAVAATVVLPTSVILLDELQGVDEAFTQRVVDRLRQRLSDGTSLVLASRQPDLARELCDEVIFLQDGKITDRGAPEATAQHYEAAQEPDARKANRVRSADDSEPATRATLQQLSQGQRLEVPPVVPAFNASAALLDATVRTAAGPAKRIDAAADEVSVEIRFETAAPNVEALCGVGFRPRDGEGVGIRLELPEPLRFVEPGTYVLLARALPGTLRRGAYEVRADAVVSNPDGGGATVIARDIGRVRIVGDELDDGEPAQPPVTHWDGQLLSRAEAEWSIE